MRRLFLIASLVFAVTAMGCASINHNGSARWRLAYANDPSGRCTDGNINTLIEAVRDGSPVRVVLNHGSYEYATNVESIWVKDGIVYAQSTPMVSSRFDGDRLVFLDDSYNWYFNFNTRGYRDVITWKIGEHAMAKDGHGHDQVAIKWFVQ